ncbi:MAG: dihydroorotate dehydrogenase electron transfer subunit [Dehalococcoidales bacterium]|nr:dihydroorotate dehydrogenase electron transfer subunit [Dehalococcoidales bacterium]MDZ4230643.1 dihydroorotate dehydrogenase electron transfer subunit [Dehalococcoidales bacterium]
MKQVLAPIVSVTGVSSGFHLMWLDSPEIASESRPGQFVMVRCGEETTLRRPLSIHQVDDGKVAFLFSVIGKGTRWLSRRQAGDKLDISGPMGNGFSIYPASQELLLVGGGIGIAPLCYLAQEALRKGCRITLLAGAQTAACLYPERMLPAEINVACATDDGTTGKMGMITGLLPDYADRADQVFACGPLPMYRTMAQMPELKDKPVQVSLEMRMGCGRGVCYGCTLKTQNGLKLVCEHGPVFEMGDILWDELPPALV